MQRHVRTMIGWSVCAVASAMLVGCGQGSGSQSTPAASQANDTASQVARGKYLVTAIGCADCHTTKKMGPNGPEPDPSMMLAGHPEQMKMPAPPQMAADSPWAFVVAPTLTAWSGPWGVSFAANLTPDQNTGLGNWTQDMFIKAMRTGKHMGVSRQILPPMPWQNFAQMTDQDLAAIYQYLRTIPPIVNHVPDPVPPTGTH